jgi:hypothetical protein
MQARRKEINASEHSARARRQAVESLQADVNRDPELAKRLKDDDDKWVNERIEQEIQQRIKTMKPTPDVIRPGTRLEPASNDTANAEIGTKLVQKATQNVQQQEELVARVQDAKAALALAVDTFRKDTIEFLREMDEHLLQMRQLRMAMDNESRQVLTQLKDVRQFFLSEQHVDEVKRLQEFSVVLEKLQAFKESGFLDAVTDTILKLGVK